MKASAPYPRRQRPAMKAEALKRKPSQLKSISAMGVHVGGPKCYLAADFPIVIIVVEGSFLVEFDIDILSATTLVGDVIVQQWRNVCLRNVPPLSLLVI